ncbi:MAG: hypothetical protein ACLQPH_12610 [Acidimicrobiales bacterium]
MAALIVGAVLVAIGLAVIVPSSAGATVTPTLTVSPSSGPVGSIVTVQFGPPGNGCAGPLFESAAGFTGGTAMLPYVGDHGSQDFVIPNVLGDPGPDQNAPVSPGQYMFVLACDTTNNPATEVIVSVPFTVTPPQPPHFVGMASTADGKGYWLAQSNGGVYSYGDASFYGSLGATPPDWPVVGMVATPDGKGYWLVASDGGVFAFGDASFYGSLSTAGTVSVPVMGMAATPDGKGYWLVTSEGAVYPYGDAHSFGSFGPAQPYQPVVGMASTADGQGYWEVAADGGIFSFGDAHFSGSMGGHPLNQPVVGMTPDPKTGGYWEVAADGGVFSFDAPFLGSTGGLRLNKPITAIIGATTGLGYRLVAADGGVFDFGDALFCGSAA